MSAAGEPNFAITVHRRGELRTVSVTGELDLSTAPQLEAAMREQLEAGPVTLQLDQLSFIDSSGIRVLHGLLPARSEDPPRLTISPLLQDNVRQVLQMTGLLELLLDDANEDATLGEGGGR
jgi:anti-anti-sigma factor